MNTCYNSDSRCATGICHCDHAALYAAKARPNLAVPVAVIAVSTVVFLSILAHAILTGAPVAACN